MRKQVLTLIGATVVLSMAAPSGQVPGATAPSKLGVTKPWTNQRAPWGDPNLQGIWSSGYVNTAMERPKEFGGREYLTDEDVKAELKRIVEGQDHSTGGTRSTAAREGDTGTYNTVFSGRGREVIRSRRT